jgi:hypothetical protein
MVGHFAREACDGEGMGSEPLPRAHCRCSMEWVPPVLPPFLRDVVERHPVTLGPAPTGAEAGGPGSGSGGAGPVVAHV